MFTPKYPRPDTAPIPTITPPTTYSPSVYNPTAYAPAAGVVSPAALAFGPPDWGADDDEA